MVKQEILSVCELLYAIHCELMLLNVAGKDAKTFVDALDKVGDAQRRLNNLISQLGPATEEKEDAGNTK